MVTIAKVLSGLMGVCVGDALGVPVEFTSRGERLQSPVKSMLGYGTWHQPPGTWSDDSSLTLCLAECLCEGYSLDAIAHSFSRWYTEGYWGAHGKVFDIGGTTRQAIINWQQGISPIKAGCTSENSNGNGSLMRILPMVYFYQTLTFRELIERVHQVSCITHGHLRSQMACGIYISIAIELLVGMEPKAAYLQALDRIQQVYCNAEYALEKPHFDRVFSGEIADIPIEEINSGGYVIHTLEASLWCLLNSSSYAQAVLKAVNLGKDTDTTAAVTGGLAGIYYGWEGIPSEWRDQIARKKDIMDLASRLSLFIGNREQNRE